MGRAVYYCKHCSSMLRDQDFEKGKAVRVDETPFCLACAANLFPADRLKFLLGPEKPPADLLPPEPAPAPLGDVTPRRAARVQARPETSKTGPLLGVGLGAAALIVVVVALAAGSRNEKPGAPRPVAEKTPEATPLPPVAPTPSPPRPAPPPVKPAEPFAEELARLEGEVRSALGKEEFGRALQLLDEAAPRHSEPGWNGPIGRSRAEVNAAAAALYPALEKSAADARRRGATEEVRAVSERVGKWGIAFYRTGLEKALAAAVPTTVTPAPVAPPPPTTPPPSPVPAAVSPWALALPRIAARDYAGAAAELEKSAEFKEDVQILRQVAAMNAETAHVLAQWPRDQKISLECFDAEGNPKKVEGPVERADSFRIEVGSEIVSYGQILPGSWAELYRTRKLRKPGDTRTAGLFCLLERDPAAAKRVLGESPPAIPEKYWKLPPVDPDPREAEARKLFHEMEQQASNFAGAAAVAVKCDALLEDFRDCAVVRRNGALLAARAQGGREYFFLPENMAVTGVFRWARAGKRDGCWLSTVDFEVARRKENYVELEFSVLPEREYRVWAFVGGCCVETLSFQAQTGEYLGTDAGAPVKHGLSSSRHPTHKARREPTTWGWVRVATVKAAGGMQKARLLPDLGGFAVAYAWVSDQDKPPPREPEFKALERARAATPGDRTFEVRVDPGLIGWWRFDDGGGAVAHDSSASAAHGAVVGADWVAGVSGGALSFDGAKDTVTLGRTPVATDTFTMAFWAKPEADRKLTPEATEGVEGTADQRYAIFPVLHPTAGAGVSVGTNGVSVFEHSGNYLPSLLVHEGPIAGWTHVAVVYNDRQPRLYLNGALVKEGLRSTRAVVTSGTFGSGNERYGPYKGLLDDIRIYNRALAESEISVLASKPRTIPTK